MTSRTRLWGSLIEPEECSSWLNFWRMSLHLLIRIGVVCAEILRFISMIFLDKATLSELTSSICCSFESDYWGLLMCWFWLPNLQISNKLYKQYLERFWLSARFKPSRMRLSFKNLLELTADAGTCKPLLLINELLLPLSTIEIRSFSILLLIPSQTSAAPPFDESFCLKYWIWPQHGSKSLTTKFMTCMSRV